MITIQPLSTLTFEEALTLWNKGFEGYVYEIKMTLDQFIHRFGNEELSLEWSLVAFVDEEPAGIVLNGIRTINGEKVGWNGGTGVAVKYRRSGVGKALIQATLDLYKEQGVKKAILEAASTNTNAIHLYELFGYEINDRLVFLENKDPLSSHAFSNSSPTPYHFRRGLAQEAGHLAILDSLTPWQTQWQSLRKDGELLVVLDQDKEIGYFLYRNYYSKEGEITNLVLFSASVSSNRPDQSAIVSACLKELFQPLDQQLRRSTFNFKSSNEEIVKQLIDHGFVSFNEQVFMVKEIN